MYTDLVKQITIPCGHCCGHGVVLLHDHYVQTLSDFDTPSPYTAGENKAITTEILLKAAESAGRPIKLPALCNRLNKLERLGLVAKKQSIHPTGGAWYLWYRIGGDDDA